MIELAQEDGKNLTVVAVFHAIKGRQKDLEKELASLVTPTRLEPGCINYDLHRSIEDPTVYIFHENWKNKKALDQHLEMPYLKEFLEKSKKLLDKPVELYLCGKI